MLRNSNSNNTFNIWDITEAPLEKEINKTFRFSKNETAFLEGHVAYDEFIARTGCELKLSDFYRILKRDFDCLVKRQIVNKKRIEYIHGLAIKPVPYALKNDPEFIRKARIHFRELFIITHDKNHHVAYSVLTKLFRFLDSKFYTKPNILLSVLREQFSLKQRYIGKRYGFCGVQLTEKAIRCTETMTKMRFENGVFRSVIVKEEDVKKIH